MLQGGTIKERDRLFVQTTQAFYRRFKIDIRTGYDKLVFSPGAEPIKPPIPGVSLPGIFALRSVHDTDRIKELIEKKSPWRALIVGAGFIGFEMAEQVMTPLDYEMAAVRTA